MFKRRKRKSQRLYTQAEVDQYVTATAQRFTVVLHAVTARLLSDADRKRFSAAWEWECSQDAARYQADNGMGPNETN